MAAPKSTASPAGTAITLLELDVGVMTCYIRGTSPLIFNRMAEKAKRELLLPKGRKTAADKAQNLKHNPPQEFRDSVYRWTDNDHPTRLKFPSPAFKGILGTAALEVPGAKKTQIGRLTWVEGTHVNIYGIPKLFMSVVRSADMNRTPDIRTRALLESWCAEVTLSYVQPTLNHKTIATLLAAGGLVSGMGDYRQEKGSGNYGQFRIVSQDDPEFALITKIGGREAQDAALEACEPVDDESAELLAWYYEEVVNRGREKKVEATTEPMNGQGAKRARGRPRKGAEATVQ